MVGQNAICIDVHGKQAPRIAQLQIRGEYEERSQDDAQRQRDPSEGITF
jgi:hypothetical protein